jgi:hypothetical protein
VPHVSKASASPIRGGTFEASGVVSVPGTSGVLFVDDGTPDAVFWTELDASGRQTADAVRVPIGASVTDPEGITHDGKFFYVVGSQSKKPAGGAGLVRFRFDPATRTANAVESVSGLADFLRASSPELARAARSGMNVEGLAWDPERSRLLLGLRGPADGADALVVPVALADASGPLAASNLRVQPLVRLRLGGMGVRGIEYDAESKAFLVLAGATDKDKRVDFKLWEWNGDGAKPSLAERATIDRDLKPEGVARVGGALFLACDVGTYVALAQ